MSSPGERLITVSNEIFEEALKGHTFVPLDCYLIAFHEQLLSNAGILLQLSIQYHFCHKTISRGVITASELLHSHPGQTEKVTTSFP